MKGSVNFILLICVCFYGFAQDITVTGTVTGSDVKETLPQVNVVVKGTTTGTTTDLAGNYEITLPEGQNTLVFTFVGYSNKEVTVTESGTVDVTLEPSDIEVNPVVVSASRKEERILDAPASVTVINAEKIETQNAITVVDHLQYTPGVDVMKTGLASSNVVVRGFNNIFSGAMLNIIDNRIARVPSLRVNAFQLIPTSNYDIERMEIVRGPGSALYGPNAADGVLAIFTKSPLDIEGKYETRVSLAAGLRAKGGDTTALGIGVDEGKPVTERGLIQGEFRHVTKFNDKIGLKLSGGYAGGYDWRYYDIANEPAVGDTLVFGNVREGKVFERNNSIEPKPFDRDFHLRKINGDFRLDFRITKDIELILNGGFSMASGIELTGLGAAQVDNWIYSYGQVRLRWKNLYVQYFINSSNAGDTYLIPQTSVNAEQVRFLVDKSKLHVAQIQHSYKPIEKLHFIYGVDGLFTTPVTEGTINGRFEDDDNIYQVGGYLQGEWDIITKLSLVGAIRADWHSDVSGIFWSPRAALVYKPTSRHTLRATYNRAFSSPSTLNLSLDISNGVIPFGRDGENGINIRAIGNPNGYSYHYLNDDPANDAQMILPKGNTWYNVGDKSVNHIYLDSLSQFLITQLKPLAPANLQSAVPLLIGGLLSGLSGPTGAINTVDHKLFNYVTGDTAVINSYKDFGDIDNQITQTWELGYKGIIADRFFLTGDFYYTRISNYVSPLINSTGSVILDPTSLANILGGDTTGGLLHENLQPFKAIVDPLLDGNPDYGSGVANGTSFDEIMNILMGATSQIPIGSVTPEDEKIGSDIILNYVNLGRVDIWGFDIGGTFLATDFLNFSFAYSYVSEEKVSISNSSRFAYLNAPQNKLALGAEYKSKKLGLSARAGYRWQSAFRGESAVYAGDVESAHYLDLGVSYALPFSKETKISVDVTNVTNNKHRPFPGTPKMGTLAMLRITHTFKPKEARSN